MHCWRKWSGSKGTGPGPERLPSTPVCSVTTQQSCCDDNSQSWDWVHRIPTIPKGQRTGSGPVGADKYDPGWGVHAASYDFTPFKKEAERAGRVGRAESEAAFKFQSWMMVV